MEWVGMVTVGLAFLLLGRIVKRGQRDRKTRARARTDRIAAIAARHIEPRVDV